MNNKLVKRNKKFIDIDAIIEDYSESIVFMLGGKEIDLGVITIGDTLKMLSLIEKLSEQENSSDLSELDILNELLVYLVGEELAEYIYNNLPAQAAPVLLLEIINSYAGNEVDEEEERRELEKEGFKENEIELKNGETLKIPSRNE